MKILHIGKYFEPFKGGIENVMQDLMNEQVEQGHEVSCIVHQHDVGAPFESIEIRGYKCFKAPIITVLAFTPLAPKFYSILKDVVLREKPDVIHIHMPNVSAFWCLLLSRLKFVPWVVHWHADVLGSQPTRIIRALYPFYSILERKLLKRASAIIATSPPYLENSKPLRNFRDKTTVVPLGIKELELVPPPTITSRDNTLNLLIIGRLTYYKGHRIVLKAMSTAGVKNVHLSIIGDGQMARELRLMVEDLSLSDRVSFLGRVSDTELVEMIDSADAICLPSVEKTEAFGVVLLEAMRQAKPCVVSDVRGSGMSWVVQHDVTGYVVKSEDVDCWAKAIIDCQDKRNLRKMGENGKKRFESMFSIKPIAKKIEALYLSLESNTILD